MLSLVQFHAVMIDETGCEFGVTFKSSSREAAYNYLAEEYPESRVDQLEDLQDTINRENAMWERIAREEDGIFYDEEEY